MKRLFGHRRQIPGSEPAGERPLRFADHPLVDLFIDEGAGHPDSQIPQPGPVYSPGPEFEELFFRPGALLPLPIWVSGNIFRPVIEEQARMVDAHRAYAFTGPAEGGSPV